VLFECFTVLLILIFIIICVGLAFVIIKKTGSENAIMTNRTMILHRQITYSLSVQVMLNIRIILALFQASLPIILIAMPLVIVTILIVSNLYRGICKYLYMPILKSRLRDSFRFICSILRFYFTLNTQLACNDYYDPSISSGHIKQVA
jgi:hypothetical protein